jgi:hypothetical protein
LEVGFSLLYIGIFLGCIALFIKGDNYITVAYLWCVAYLSIHLNTTIKYITYSFYVDRLLLFFIGEPNILIRGCPPHPRDIISGILKGFD